MHWIVQENIFNEPRYPDVINTLDSGDITYTIVKVVPFSHELDPKPELPCCYVRLNGDVCGSIEIYHDIMMHDYQPPPIAVIGSYTLVKIASKYGWGPGVFYNDQIDHEVYTPVFGKDMLNWDSVIVPFGHVQLIGDSFIRPAEDSKAFTGQVFSPGVFKGWQELIKVNIDEAIDFLEDDLGVTSATSFGTVTSSTRVLVSSVKEIFAEYRIFVVDQRIVAWSQYSQNGRLHQIEYVPEELIYEFVPKMIDIWVPDRAFVIDIALTAEGYKIIEFNNINSSGWYHANVSRIIQAIDGLA